MGNFYEETFCETFVWTTRRRWCNGVKRGQGDIMEQFLGHGNWRVERQGYAAVRSAAAHNCITCLGRL